MDVGETDLPTEDREAATKRAERVAGLRHAGFPKPLGTLFDVMTGALAVQVTLHAFTLLCEAFARGAVLPGPGGERGLLGHLYLAAFFVFLVAIPLGCVTWMRWLDWSVKNRLIETDGRFGLTPARVVWAYFIPGLNLYRPLLDLKRLWRSEQRFTGGAPVLLTVWWLVTLAHLATMLGDVRPGITLLTIVSSALGVVSCALALALLRAFRRVQAHGSGSASGPAAEEAEPSEVHA